MWVYTLFWRWPHPLFQPSSVSFLSSTRTPSSLGLKCLFTHQEDPFPTQKMSLCSAGYSGHFHSICLYLIAPRGRGSSPESENTYMQSGDLQCFQAPLLILSRRLEASLCLFTGLWSATSPTSGIYLGILWGKFPFLSPWRISSRDPCRGGSQNPSVYLHTPNS